MRDSLFLLGTVVNACAVLFGSVIGLILPQIPERMRSTIMQGIALCVILIGLGMALADQNDILIIILSIVIGSLLGEGLNIENGLLRFGHWIERKIQKIYKGPVAEAFVASSLLFCVGSMAIVGAIQDGVQGVHRTLFAKSMLDMVSSIVFSSTMGFGVALSAIPIFLYEGLIALISHLVGTALNAPAEIACMTATGGLLIVGIGLNLYGIKKIAVGNLLPAIVIAPLAKGVMPHVIQAATKLLQLH